MNELRMGSQDLGYLMNSRRVESCYELKTPNSRYFKLLLVISEVQLTLVPALLQNFVGMTEGFG